MSLSVKYESDLYFALLRGMQVDIDVVPAGIQVTQSVEKWLKVSLPVLSNAFQTAVCGAFFMAAAAPKLLLPGYNRLACCFNKRGWFGGRRGEE